MLVKNIRSPGKMAKDVIQRIRDIRKKFFQVHQSGFVHDGKIIDIHPIRDARVFVCIIDDHVELMKPHSDGI
jgi:hypothetical protein